MPTVSETELEQKTSEYMEYVKDFMSNKKQEFVFHSRKADFKISLFDGDVTLEFQK